MIIAFKFPLRTALFHCFFASASTVARQLSRLEPEGWFEIGGPRTTNSNCMLAVPKLLIQKNRRIAPPQITPEDTLRQLTAGCEPDFRDPQSGGIEPEKMSGIENSFLPPICLKSVPDTN